jgi:alpha-beta hydrolase superfamily lysophospholipase
MPKREIRFNSFGNRITGILFTPHDKQGKLPSVIISHGAFEFKERYFELCEYLAARGIAAFVMDMNGHGESDGDRYHIDLKKWIGDIQGGIDCLLEQPEIDPGSIAAFGLSTGGTAVIDASIIDPRIKALILFAPTVRNIMTTSEIVLYSLLTPLGFMKRVLTGEPVKIPMAQAIGKKSRAWDKEINETIVHDRRFRESYVPIPGSWQSSVVDTIKSAERIGIPTLILHGEKDEIDSPESSKLLFERMRCKKYIITMPETGHAGHLDRHRKKLFEYVSDWVYEHCEAV